jgi:hypothetical protein
MTTNPPAIEADNWHFPLLAHKAGVRTFDLSSGMNYISMKDQVVRATTLVNCLHTCGLFTKGTKADFHLTVVGAGVAGVSAACHAAALGWKVLVLEQGDTRFSLQKQCESRYVSFSMYDWPEAHASVGKFPELDDLPVKSAPGPSIVCKVDHDKPVLAKTLVEAWDQQIDTEDDKRITWKFKTKVIPPGRSNGLSLSSDQHIVPYVEVKYQNVNNRTNPAQYLKTTQIIIFATGIGVETTVQNIDPKEHAYGPPAFWTDFPRPPWEPGIDHSDKELVIAGAGDGAIQDVLKVIYQDRSDNLLNLAARCGLKKSELARILSAERHVMRQLIWNTPKAEAFSGLQQVIDEIVAELLQRKKNKAPGKSGDFLNAQALLPRIPKIHWIASSVSDDKKRIVFSKCYALNRFLATLTLALLENDIMPGGAKLNLVQGKIQRVGKQNGRYVCQLDDGKTEFGSDFPPLIRLGIEKGPGLGNNADYLSLRKALASVPLPFKPSNSPKPAAAKTGHLPPAVKRRAG